MEGPIVLTAHANARAVTAGTRSDNGEGARPGGRSTRHSADRPPDRILSSRPAVPRSSRLGDCARRCRCRQLSCNCRPTSIIRLQLLQAAIGRITYSQAPSKTKCHIPFVRLGD
jgi:hypothetical protein